MKLLVLDNYDSFTYNLVHIIKEILPAGSSITVARNDKITLDAVDAFDNIILSPGPGVPNEAGIMPDLVLRYAKTKQILGICLGHQCIGEQFGAQLHNLETVVHGKPGVITILDASEPLFKGISNPFTGGRYHSWVVSDERLPDSLTVTARASDGAIMALRHREYAVAGLQFHPESVLTDAGKIILHNWIETTDERVPS